MKRNSVILLLFIICISVLTPGTAHMQTVQYNLPAAVADQASLFSQAETEEMERLIETIRNEYQMDAVVLTTYSVPYSGGNDRISVDYADRYYEDHGYGLGNDRSGLILLLDMTNRFNYISTAGTMIDFLTDQRIDAILSAASEELAEGAYGRAMIRELDRVIQYLDKGIEEGAFRFDSETGQRLSGVYNRLTPSETGVAALAGLMVAILVYFLISGAYTLRGGTYRYDPRDRKVNFTVNEFRFIRESVRRYRRQSNPPAGGRGVGGRGGSSVHRSSGGMTHGGGGRHF